MEPNLRGRVRDGDPDAFGALFDDHSRAVYNLAIRVDRVQGRRVAAGLGEEQAAFESGEGGEGEVAGLGVGAQLAAFAHRGQAVADGAFPAGAPGHVLPAQVVRGPAD
jgi:hypothetical protein